MVPSGGVSLRRANRRLAQRFLISILQQCGKEAPTALREWAQELEALAAESASDEGPSDPRGIGNGLGVNMGVTVPSETLTA